MVNSEVEVQHYHFRLCLNRKLGCRNFVFWVLIWYAMDLVLPI